RAALRCRGRDLVPGVRRAPSRRGPRGAARERDVRAHARCVHGARVAHVPRILGGGRRAPHTRGPRPDRGAVASRGALALNVLALAGLLLAQSPDSLARYIESELARQHIPGASVAVLQGNRVILARGFGLANVELHVPASDSTIYQSGSMGKQFTAALVEMLVGAGRLRLDDTIIRWFPEGARVWHEVTVRHLLTHTSGVPEYTDSTFDARRDRTEDELVRLAAV